MDEPGTNTEVDLAKASIQDRSFKNRDQLFEGLTRELIAQLKKALEARPFASLVLSGGSTPVPLFTLLSRADLDWQRVQITLADERWVDPGHDASNEHLVRRHLLQGPAAAAQFTGLKTEHATPEEGQASCEQRLRALSRPFDAAVLGMGNDGHTASLFPDADHLATALDPPEGQACIAMRAPSASQARISLTLPALLECRWLALLCTGQDKHDTFSRALASGPIEAMPVRAILRAKRQVAFYWAP